MYLILSSCFFIADKLVKGKGTSTIVTLKDEYEHIYNKAHKSRTS